MTKLISVSFLRRRRSRDLGLLAQLTFVGLTGGLALPAALEAAIPHLEHGLAAEVGRLLRRARETGLSAVLMAEEATGERFYAVLARAYVTGSPLSGAVAAFMESERERRRAEATERARKLPVKLLLPLTLLILPGFALLTVGPSLLSSLESLLGPFTSLP